MLVSDSDSDRVGPWKIVTRPALSAPAITVDGTV